MTKLELWYPFPKTAISQAFAANANPLYHGEGLKGHTGIDFDVPYGSTIWNAAEAALVYSVLNKDNPDPSLYRAVFTLVEPGDGYAYEVSYGHCSAITTGVDVVDKAGVLLASVGNTGEVYAGNHMVTKEERLAGSQAGRHLHFQVRKCEKVKNRTGRQLIMDGYGLYKRKGSFYEVVDYDNGYNGCIDPAPFFNGFLAKDRDTVLTIRQKIAELMKRLTGV